MGDNTQQGNPPEQKLERLQEGMVTPKIIRPEEPKGMVPPAVVHPSSQLTPPPAPEQPPQTPGIVPPKVIPPRQTQPPKPGKPSRGK